MIKIIENSPGIDILQAKEMIRREYESMFKKEASKIPLRAAIYGNGFFAPIKRKKFFFKEIIDLRCFHRNKVEHVKRDCWKLNHKN